VLDSDAELQPNVNTSSLPGRAIGFRGFSPRRDPKSSRANHKGGLLSQPLLGSSMETGASPSSSLNPQKNSAGLAGIIPCSTCQPHRAHGPSTSWTDNMASGFLRRRLPGVLDLPCNTHFNPRLLRHYANREGGSCHYCRGSPYQSAQAPSPDNRRPQLAMSRTRNSPCLSPEPSLTLRWSNAQPPRRRSTCPQDSTMDH